MTVIMSSGVDPFNASSFTQFWQADKPFLLDLGGELASYTVAYRTWGKLSAGADNVVVVCHPLTGSADADDWWAPMFGRGKTFDPSRDFIICSNVLGGCYGSTGAMSEGPSGRRYGSCFPSLTIRDQVHAQMALADALGVREIRLVVGGSMGGLQTLEWAAMDPGRVRSIAVIAASARHSAWCMAWSETQRMALRADPVFNGGEYDGSRPVAGLGAARAIAMVTYRSPSNFDQRYGSDGKNDNMPPAPGPDATGERVRAWLHHHAHTFVNRFDANCYLSLIDAMDRHDIGRDRGGVVAALRAIHQPALVMAISSDALYVPTEQRVMAGYLPHSDFVEVQSPHGHDGFLIDAHLLEPYLTGFYDRVRAATSEGRGTGEPSLEMQSLATGLVS